MTLAARLLMAESCVLIVVCPLGYAIDGRRSLTWATTGAAVWTLVFAFAALRLGRSVLGWGVSGGLICGSAWAVGYIVGELLVTASYQSYGFGWAIVFGAFGGVGAGILAGAATEIVPDAVFQRAIRLGSYAAAICWGGLSAGGLPVRVGLGSGVQALGWGSVGVLAGLITLPLGRRIGRAVSPVVLFFEELGPYLAEMARPLASFAAGFLTLTVVFGGLYGTCWRLQTDSFRNLPSTPGVWDFVEFSLMTATTGNTSVEPVTAPVRMLKAIEVILGTGWLIVVFGALSVHLAPRLEQIAQRLNPSGKSDTPRES